MLAYASLATAQTTQYWDPTLTGSSTGGGAGTWSSAANWFDGTSDTAWVNGNLAVFGGTAGSVTLGANETANGVTFTTTGYTLSGSATLTLGGTTPTITVPTGTTTINAKLGGSGGLAESGPGTLVLGGANTYTGGTAIPAGSTLKITVAAGAGASSGTVALTDNAVFSVAFPGTATLAYAVTGGSTSVVNVTPVSGNTSLSGLWSGFNGTFNCLAGAANASTYANTANALTIPATATWNIASGATLDINVGGGVNNASVILNGPGGSGNFGALRLDNCNQKGNVLLAGPSNNNQIGNASLSGSSTVSGIISDGGLGYGVTRWGYANASYLDTLVFSGQNTYSGATILAIANLQVGSAENPGVSGPLGKSPAINPGSILFNTNGTINGGILQFSSANQFDYSGRFSTSANQAFNIDVNGQTVTFATALDSTGGTLTLKDRAGGGTLILSGANTYNGTTTLSSGTLQLAAAENPGTSGPLGASAASNPGSIVLKGGYLQFTGINQNDYSGRFSTAASQAYDFDVNGQTVTVATALVSSGGTLTLRDAAGGGKLILSAANTYGGYTTVNAGTLEVSTGSIAGNVVVNGGTLQLDNNSALSATATLTLPSSPGAGTVNLNFTGTLNAGPMFFGPVLQSYGTWGAIGSGAANESAAFTGTGRLNVTPIVYPQSYWDAAGLVASPGGGGSGTWDLSTADWWVSGASDTTWTSGDVANFAGSAGTVTVGANLTANGLVFATDGYVANESGSYTLTLGGSTPIITVPAGGTTTLGVTLAGPNILTVSGSGTLVLRSNSTFTAGTVVSPNTTLQITTATGAGSGTVNLTENSTLSVVIPGAATFANAVSGPSNSVVSFTPVSGNTSLGGSWSGFNGTVNCLAGAANAATYANSAGSLSIPATATWNIAAGATLDINVGGGVNNASVIINGPGGSANYGALRLDNCNQKGNVLLAGPGNNNQIGNAGSGSTSTVSGVISDGGLGYGLNRVGYAPYNNTLVLSGQNTYSGPTTLTLNTLRLGSAEDPGTSGPLGNSPAANPGSIIFNGGTLQFSSTNQFDYSGRFSTDAGQLYNIDVNGQSVTFATPLSSSGGILTLSNSTADGTLVLSGTNTYNGGTIINSGTLDITNSGSILGNVTLNAGALELDGNAALSPLAVLLLPSSPAAGTVNLNFTGVQAISALFFGSVSQSVGTWGAIGSSAANQSAAFTGAGVLNVTAGHFPYSYWDPYGNNAAPGSGGSGNWDSSTPNWSVNGGTDTTWSPGGIAFFEGSPGSVTLIANESANALTFTVDGYAINGSSTLTLVGGSPTITVPTAGTAAIEVTLAGSAPLTISGGGTLALDVANTYSGGTTVNAGTALQISAVTSAGTGPITLVSNAVLTVNSIVNTLATGVANAVTGGTNSVINVQESGLGNTFITGSLAGFNGTINCLPGGPPFSVVVESAGPLAIPLGATWNIAAGATLDLNFGSASDAANVIINGPGGSANYGALRLDSCNQTGDILLAGAGNDNEIGNAGRSTTSTISGVISDGGQTNGLNRVGYPLYTNTLVLSGQNTYRGATTLTRNTLRVGAPENPGTSGPLGKSPALNPGSIIFNGGTLQYSSANQFDYSGRFSTDPGQAFNIDVNGQQVTFATPLASSGGALTLSDNASGGKLILTAANTFDGGVTVNSGTLAVSSGSLQNNTDVTVNGGTLELDNKFALAMNANLTVASSATVNLAYIGAQFINMLTVAGAGQAPGVYGASANNPGGIFTGSGTLAVGIAPITISSATISNGQFTVSWSTVPGNNYNVYTATNLTPPVVWTLATPSPITATDTTTTFTLPGSVSSVPQLFVQIQE